MNKKVVYKGIVGEIKRRGSANGKPTVMFYPDNGEPFYCKCVYEDEIEIES